MNCSPELCSGNRQREKPGTAFRDTSKEQNPEQRSGIQEPGTAFRDTGTRNSVPEYRNPEQRSGIQEPGTAFRNTRTRNSVPGYRAHVWLT